MSLNQKINSVLPLGETGLRTGNRQNSEAKIKQNRCLPGKCAVIQADSCIIFKSGFYGR